MSDLDQSSGRGPRKAGISRKSKAAPAKSARARRPAGKKALDGGKKEETPFVVGVGASAGGLQALQSFFGAIKEPPHAAFVVVQHLSPDFKSFMVELLTKHTRMPVQRAEQNLAVQPGHIYLIPPSTTLTIDRGRLHLKRADPHRGTLHLPIDQFFFSLAKDQQHRAVAIVLSGTGSDGTAGVRAIKDAGGVIMVQSEDSAQFDGMPRSAIGTGLADYVLPPEKMSDQLTAYLKQPLLARMGGVSRRQGKEVDAALAEIFPLLRAQCGVDFSHYKPATIDRRIARRMGVCQIDSLTAYATHLAQSPREVSLLFNELMIGVTSFFRDKDSWAVLEKRVLPDLIKALAPDEQFRAWVCGCSTGEEAYSLAIMVAEQMEKLKVHRSVKIFATDISKDALAVAARGEYTPSETAAVSRQRLQRFFTQDRDGFRIKTNIRETVVFANHNVLSDPPFTKLSLVCCRNLLIYLQAPIQQRVLTLFSFALMDKGVMFLGSSENVGDVADRYLPLHARANLFRNRRVDEAPPLLANPLRDRRRVDPVDALQRANARVTAADVPSVDDINKRIFLEAAPACIAIDSRDDVIHVVGDDSTDYLRVAPGTFTRNLFKLVQHSGLLSALRSALIRAQPKGDKFTLDHVRFQSGRKPWMLRLRVRPLPDVHGRPTGVRLIFIDREAAPARPVGKRPPARADTQSALRITELERDLSLTRESLQATVQDLETSNEEIQAANEELLASNEELQSTNEELQSVNEELHTVNAENQNRIEVLTQLTNDVNNLLGTVGLGVLLVDPQLRVRRASRSALQLLELNEADLGVPIETVARILNAKDLPALVEQVITSGRNEEREMQRRGAGQWLLMQCVPFRNELGRTQGVVLTIFDITERHLFEQKLLAQAALTQSVLDAMEACIAILDGDGRVVHVNKNWHEFGEGDGGGEVIGLRIGSNYFDACRRVGDTISELRTCLDGIRKVANRELERYSGDYRWDSSSDKRWFRLHAVPLQSPESGLAVAHFNITAMKRAEALLAENESSQR